MLQWEFPPEGQLCLIDVPKTDVPSETSDIFIIPKMKSTYSFKYLDIKSSLTGSQQPQLFRHHFTYYQRIQIFSASPFTRQQTKLYILNHITPKLAYPLSCTSFSESQYFRLHKTFVRTAILALGYNCHWSLTVVYGKDPYG